MSFIPLGFLAASGSIATNFNSIATVTVGSGGSAYVEFTSISGAYKHLQIRSITRALGTANQNQNILMQFNGDTASNYTRHLLYAQGGGASAYGAGSQSSIFTSAAPNGNAISNTFSGQITDILDYANTNKYKTARTLGGYDHNGTNVPRLSFESGLWTSTNAITSIKIFPSDSASWAEYSSFALYGVK